MITLILSSLIQLSFAAPWPVTGSSNYLDTKKNYFLHPYRIELNLEKTPYSVDLTKNDPEKWVITEDGTKSLITLRIKRFQNDQDYEKSLKTWIREYQRSGFQLVTQQMGERRPERGWLHLQDSKGQQLFQYFRYQNKTWVYFNCIGQKADIARLQKACENLNSRVQIRTL